MERQCPLQCWKPCWGIEAASQRVVGRYLEGVDPRATKKEQFIYCHFMKEIRENLNKDVQMLGTSFQRNLAPGDITYSRYLT